MAGRWTKKSILKSDVDELCSRYGIDPISASIFLRRGITQGNDILYFLESDLRFQHNPFLFNSMEDVVDRIMSTAEEGERVLIFGDRDVDGITSTTLLYEELLSLGIDARYKVPEGDETYGLSIGAVEEFAKQEAAPRVGEGALIITVDCGISNMEEIKRAGDLGIDVIVLDHHNIPANLPPAQIILDAKLPDSGYPFQDISACALVYKVISALRFAKSNWYKTDIALLNAEENGDEIIIDCVQVRNLVPSFHVREKVKAGGGHIFGTKLYKALEGRVIFCWDKKRVSALLASAFGAATQFNLNDAREELSGLFPSFANESLKSLKTKSKIAQYGNHEPTEIGGFYNIFVTYVRQSLRAQFPQDYKTEDDDIQLVGLAALSDIMPMKNENRFFVKRALQCMNSGKIRKGLRELCNISALNGKRITSKDLSWTLIPALNAAGRLGVASVAVRLFTEKDPGKREELARKITDMNKDRKRLTQEAIDLAYGEARESVKTFGGRLCFVYDERINRGVAGLAAGRFAERFDVPAIVITCAGDNLIGSMRSKKGVNARGFLSQFEDLFSNYGGHDAAAGFNLEKKNYKAFEQRLRELAKNIVLSDEKEEEQIDAVIPADYMTKDLINIVDMFEPYGNENKDLVFLSEGLPIEDGMTMGNANRLHLKVVVNCGKTKWPCVFWGEGERLGRDFRIGDRVDILFHVERNSYNGMESLQLNLIDIHKSQTNK